MKNSAILVSILTLISVIGLGLTGCKPTSTTSTTVTQTQTVTTTKVVVPPEYHTLKFTLDTTNSDYILPIYLGNTETLHLTVVTGNETNSVRILIQTPSGKQLGSYNQGQFANGTLEEGFNREFSYFSTSFKPADYGWGEGYYRIDCQNGNALANNVTVEYWVGE